MPGPATAILEDPQGVLRGLRKRFAAESRGRDDLLTAAGAFAKARAKETFVKQEGPDGAWQARGVPNIAGIIRDLANGTNIPASRFEDRPALIDVGTLKKSIEFRVVDKDTVEIGTMEKYAALHQFGGKSNTLPITRTVQENLYAAMKKIGANRSGSYAAKAAGKAERKAERAWRRLIADNDTVRAADAAVKAATDPESKKSARKWAKQVRHEAATLTPKPEVSVTVNPDRVARHDGLQALRWMLNKKFRNEVLTLKIPARKFLGLTAVQLNDLQAEIGRRVVVVP